MGKEVGAWAWWWDGVRECVCMYVCVYVCVRWADTGGSAGWCGEGIRRHEDLLPTLWGRVLSLPPPPPQLGLILSLRLHL